MFFEAVAAILNTECWLPDEREVLSSEHAHTAEKLPQAVGSDKIRPRLWTACCGMSSAMDQPGQITQLLQRWSGGDQSALDELTPLVYNELRQVAAAYLRRERPSHTLQATALVNEAYLKLVGHKHGRWEGRKHFYGIAARLMRQVLVEHARRHRAEKRGGGGAAVTLSHADEVAGTPEVDILAVHEALERLANFDEQQARIVELRFFGGLSIVEVADALSIGHATVEREWGLARSWLRKELR